jgi:phosphatidate cytidylyltransferase
VLIACLSDTFAYVGGNIYGKTLISLISPKKTWEGFFTGLAGSLFCILCLKTLFIYSNIKLCFFINYLNIIMLCLSVFVLSFLGDLVISIFKRYRGIKDISNFLPGHGGVLDRIDSIIPANIFLLVYIKYFYVAVYYTYI